MTAQQIADAINKNCDAYHEGRLSREGWDLEQRRLWNIAYRSGLMKATMGIVFPKEGHAA